jgi:probable phosphoglycerate mutase
MRLWLVRHGATDWSDAGRLNGWTDIPLNDLGRRQARDLHRGLGAKDFDGVWSSDLSRASETALLVVGPAATDGRLRELDFGRLEGLSWAECPAAIQNELLAFDEFVAPGGESVGNLRDRVLEFLGELSPGDHLVFTHGGVIRLLSREADRDVTVQPGALLRIDGGRNGNLRLEPSTRGAG